MANPGTRPPLGEDPHEDRTRQWLPERVGDALFVLYSGSASFFVDR